MNRRASFLVALAIVLAGIPVARVWAGGILPASFAYKLHSTVPLLEAREVFAPFQRIADVDGLFEAPFTSQAGEHADMSVLFALNVGDSEAVFEGKEIPAETVVELPPGAILNLGDIPACSHLEFLNSVDRLPGGCPPESQVGVVSAVYAGALADRSYPLYKLAAANGHLATLGYRYEFISRLVGIQVNVDLRASGDYGLTLSSSDTAFDQFIPAPFMTIWGMPAAAAHDWERWDPETFSWGDSSTGPPLPLVANATDCATGIEEARVRLRYWTAPEQWLPVDPEDLAYRSFVPAPKGCDRLSIAPRGELSTTASQTDSPGGIELSLELPRNSDSAGLETSLLKDATLRLPAGMAVNPAALDGLAGCAPQQIGLLDEGEPPGEPVRFDAGPADCPPAAKLGQGTIDTPLLDEPLAAKIYFATPFRNPFQAALALYLVLDAPGFTAKLAARVERDPGSGRLQVHLDSLPPVPVESASLSIAGGGHGPLLTPVRCGVAPIELSLMPHSGQSPSTLTKEVRFEPVPGHACGPDGSGAAGPPLLQVGSRDATANGSSPFVLRLEGSDIRGLGVALPPGLTGRLRGLDPCGEGAIGSAEARGAGEGVIEERDPSCPLSSRVGSLLVGLGAGVEPLFVWGDVYLAGPFAGAPFSLVAITPAIAGGTVGDPLFDLGTVVDRVPLDVNPYTAAISARAGALSPVLGGTPMRIASLRLRLDRPGVMRNPSDCEALSVTAVVDQGDGTRSSLRRGFRASACNRLEFRPRLRLSAVGGRRGRASALKALLGVGADDAAIAKARIRLPASVFPHAGDSPIVGRASASSALLGQGEDLKGPVYLRSGGRLSKLVLVLAGRPDMEIVGRISREAGQVRVDFSNLPDAQLTKLVLTLRGGRGLARGFGSSCGRSPIATARFVSSRGTVRERKTSIRQAHRTADRCSSSGKRMEG